MRQLIAIIKEGWPDHRNSGPPSVKPFWNYKDELSVMEGLVFKEERIVIPVALRKNMLRRVHIEHMGMMKCKTESSKRGYVLAQYEMSESFNISYMTNSSLYSGKVSKKSMLQNFRTSVLKVLYYNERYRLRPEAL